MRDKIIKFIAIIAFVFIITKPTRVYTEVNKVKTVNIPKLNYYINHRGLKLVTKLSYDRYKDKFDYILDLLNKKNTPRGLIAIALVESGLKNNICSNAGACGIWQIMPATAYWCGIKKEERADTRLSTLCAIKYIRYLKKSFNNWNLVIMAYNVGETKLRRMIRKIGKTKDIVYKLCGEVPELLPTETCRHLPKVLATLVFLNKIRKKERK